jgi:hypothetical protein
MDETNPFLYLPQQERTSMSMYTLEELLKRWQLDTLTVEQAVGQILQQLIALQKQVKELQQATGQQPKQ